jgi:hypothetical protein
MCTPPNFDERIFSPTSGTHYAIAQRAVRKEFEESNASDSGELAGGFLSAVG